jgi:drug/metabolite transporter (DMT)-like permease
MTALLASAVFGERLGWRAWIGICVALVIALGIYPDPILSLANPTVESLLQGLNR